MDEKLRGMRVNQDQRKRLMAAGRFGIGPLIQLGMVEKDHIQGPVASLPPAAALTPAAAAAAAHQEKRRRESLSGLPLPPELPRGGGAAQGRDQEMRKEAWRKLHEDDGLADLDAFLAPKKRMPAARAVAASGSATPAVASRGPAVSVATLAAPPLSAAVEKEAHERKLAVRMVSKPVVQQATPAHSHAHSEPRLPPEAVRATASSAGARPKAASFRAVAGPSLEDVRRLQALHEPWAKDSSSSTTSQALEAAIEEIHEEELRRVKQDAKRKREEWRKAFKEEKKKKVTQTKVSKPEADIAENDADEGSDASSSYNGYKELEKRRKANSDATMVQKMDHEQRRWWGETVKGRVSNDNKGFTDADLEQRFRAQQAASAGENLMTESQVLALLKGGVKEKDKVKDRGKKKEKIKEKSSRSRERRR